MTHKRKGKGRGHWGRGTCDRRHRRGTAHRQKGPQAWRPSVPTPYVRKVPTLDEYKEWGRSSPAYPCVNSRRSMPARAQTRGKKGQRVSSGTITSLTRQQHAGRPPPRVGAGGERGSLPPPPPPHPITASPPLTPSSATIFATLPPPSPPQPSAPSAPCQAPPVNPTPPPTCGGVPSRRQRNTARRPPAAAAAAAAG